MILALDPKIHSCGVAAFDGTTLYRAGWVKGDTGENVPESWKATAQSVILWALFGDVTEVVFERPPAYRSDDPAKTVQLQGLLGVCCLVAGRFSHAQCTGYFPQQWKGTIDKDATESRVRGRLTAEEFGRVQLPPSKQFHDDVWDAIGIGLKHVGRFERKRYYGKGLRK